MTLTPSAKLRQHCYQDLIAVLDKHGARDPWLYGSVARRTDTPHSNLDLFATFDTDLGWLEHQGDIEAELEDLLQCPVVVADDCIQYEARIGTRVRRDMVPLADAYTTGFQMLPPSYPIEWTNGRRAHLEQRFGWRLVDHLERIVEHCDRLAQLHSPNPTLGLPITTEGSTVITTVLLEKIGHLCSVMGRVANTYFPWEQQHHTNSKDSPHGLAGPWDGWATRDWKHGADPNKPAQPNADTSHHWATVRAPQLRNHVTAVLESPTATDT